MPLTKNQIKWIHSLERKKNRDAENVFVAEGDKLVGDLLPLFDCRLLVATQEFVANGDCDAYPENLCVVSHDDLCRASLLNSPQHVLAVFEKPRVSLDCEDLKKGLTLMLDQIQDPGNLGTIIRIADWFGIDRIVCSEETVDAFNPKVVQATMGAIGRVPIFYTNLLDVLRSLNSSVPVYGTFLEGENIYSKSLSQNGIIIMGNEGNGISPQVGKLVSDKLFIPNFPVGVPTSESLNVAVATSITCSEFRRRTFCDK